MRRLRWDDWSAWGLGVVFMAAAFPKIVAPHDFALMVFRYQLLPYFLVNLIAIYLPWVELAAGIALFWPGAARRGAVAIALVLLVVFTLATIFNLWRGIDIACGCFSVDAEASHAGWWNIARNLLFIALAILAWGRSDGAAKQAAPAAGSPSAA